MRQEVPAFFGLHAPKEEVLMVLAMLPEKGSIRDLARATNHGQDTIGKWISSMQPLQRGE